MTEKTRDQRIGEAAANAEAMLDALDPEATHAENPTDLREIAAISAEIERLEELLVAKVSNASTAGRSWSEIGVALGVSKQGAHARFAGRTTDVSGCLLEYQGDGVWSTKQADANQYSGARLIFISYSHDHDSLGSREEAVDLVEVLRRFSATDG